MAALSNERVVQIDFIFLSAVLTKESILFQSRVKFFFVSCYWIHNLTQSLFSSYFNLSLREFRFVFFCLFEIISLRMGSPGFISLAPLQFLYVFLYCIIFCLNKNELNWTELNALLKTEICATRNCKRVTANCGGLRFAACLKLKVSNNSRTCRLSAVEVLHPGGLSHEHGWPGWPGFRELAGPLNPL